jgi:WD40 repeat protein
LLQFSTDGDRALAGSSDKTVRLGDAVTGTELHRLVGHTSAVSAAELSNDGRYARSGDGEVAKFTVRAAQDAALGDFAVTARANVKGDGFSDYELKLSVDPAGEAAREQPGKPRRRYRHLTDDLFMTHDGKLLSIAGSGWLDRRLAPGPALGVLCSGASYCRSPPPP